MSTLVPEDARIRVAVVGGGANAEHDVSLASAAAVCAHLPAAAYDVVPLTIGRDGSWRDRGRHPLGIHGAISVLASCDVVFPALHGAGGEDGTIAALCGLARIPCVGSPHASGARRWTAACRAWTRFWTAPDPTDAAVAGFVRFGQG